MRKKERKTQNKQESDAPVAVCGLLGGVGLSGIEVNALWGYGNGTLVN